MLGTAGVAPCRLQMPWGVFFLGAVAGWAHYNFERWLGRRSVESLWPDTIPSQPALCSAGGHSMYVSLAAQLDRVERTGCGERKSATCMMKIGRDRNDGMGSQMNRRLSLFVAAFMLNCAFEHAPILPMNARSAKHGVKPGAAEHHFRLSGAIGAPIDALASESVCRIRSRKQSWGEGCPSLHPDIFRNNTRLEALGATFFAAAAPRDGTAALLSLAARTHFLYRVEQWQRESEGQGVTCGSDPIYFPAALDRCRYLQARVALRAAYYDPQTPKQHAHCPPFAGGEYQPSRGAARPAQRSLDWFQPARAGTMPLEIAVHMRRGDLRSVDPGRFIQMDSYKHSLRALIAEVEGLRATWAQLGRLLLPQLHVMSEGLAADFAALPRWLNSTWPVRLHLDSDPLATIDHLIGADVLVGSISSYSNTAMMYSAGVHLQANFANEFDPPLPWRNLHKQPALQREFRCQLSAHLEYKWRQKSGTSLRF